MSKIQKRPYKKAFKAQNQMVLYKRPKFVSLTNPPTKPMKPEKKNIDVLTTTLVSPGAVNQQWSVPFLINGIAQGSSPNNRIGRKITMKSLQLKYTAIVGATVRVLTVYDKQTNGILPATIDILQGNSSVPPLADFNAMPNLSNGNRFVVISDEIMNDMYSTDVANGQCYRKINLETEYFNNITGVISDISTGSIYIMMCPVTIIATPTAIGTFSSRIRYTDV